jgi:tetratricopeptide (TPR) repeat protein
MPNIIDEYHELLDSDVSIEKVDRTLTLIENILAVQWTEEQCSFQICQTKWPKEEMTLFQQRLENDFEQSLLFYAMKYPELQQLKKVMPKSKQTQRVLKVFWTLVFFPQLIEHDWFPLKSKYSLLLDTGLILFHQAYFALLPALNANKPEKKLLLSAFQEFAHQVPSDADRYDLLGLYYEAIEDEVAATECHKNVLRLTHSEAHEFMTVVQTFWSFLVEQQKFREALDVLLETYPRVLRRDLEEFNELILMTFELQTAHYHALLKGTSQAEKWHQGVTPLQVSNPTRLTTNPIS